MYPERISRLQQRLRRRKLQAFLVTQPENRRYLSGFTALDHSIQESSGALLVPARGAPLLLTDSRFQLQAEQECSGLTISLYRRGLASLLCHLLPDMQVRRLGFESHYCLYGTAVRLKDRLAEAGIELVATRDLVEQLRIIKDADEIAVIRRSVALNEQVFRLVHATIEPGMTEQEIALALELTMRELGAERPSFETIVAFGEHAAHPHAVPTDRILQSGDLVLIDMGLVLEGYCSDMTRTFAVGEPSSQFRERVRLVRRAQLAGIRTIRAGVTGREVDRAARRVIADAGFGKYFQHALGHGVGLAVHEEPRLSAFSRRKLRPGMVVTVEPGLYLPDWGGIRLENMVVVRDDGCEVLNRDLTGMEFSDN